MQISFTGIFWRGVCRRYLTTPTLLRLIPTSMILAIGIVLNIWTHSLLSDHRDLVVHTHEVIEMTKDVLIGLDDAETGERGYLLSGDSRYLEPYSRALERLAWMTPALRSQVSDNLDQTRRLDRLSALMQQKLGELQKSVDLYAGNKVGAARIFEIKMMEQATMDTVRRVIGEITDAEKALLKARDTEVSLSEERVRGVAVVIALLSIAVRAAAELYLSRGKMDVKIVSAGKPAESE